MPVGIPARKLIAIASERQPPRPICFLIVARLRNGRGRALDHLLRIRHQARRITITIVIQVYLLFIPNYAVNKPSPAALLKLNYIEDNFLPL